MKRRDSMRMRALGCVLGAAILCTAACGSSREPYQAPAPEPEPQSGFQTDAGPIDPPDANTPCVTSSQKAEPAPLAMIILIDRSGSMSGEKWTSATGAIHTFVDRSEVVGTKVGLSFFPPETGAETCNPAVYRNLPVPIDALPDNVIPLQTALASAKPTGSATPMLGGLDGAFDAMRSFIAKEPDHQGIVILVTDGDPTQCGTVTDVAHAAAHAVAPPADLPSIRTFTIGMAGASFASLDQIAKSGGTPKSFNVGTGLAAQQGLLDALDTIRAGLVACEYRLPIPPASDGILDIESVTLEFKPGPNDPTISIRKVADASKCVATTGGYYYDDPNDPSRVVLCPASCSQVRAGTVEAKVELLFGCIQIPK